MRAILALFGPGMPARRDSPVIPALALLRTGKHGMAEHVARRDLLQPQIAARLQKVLRSTVEASKPGSTMPGLSCLMAASASALASSLGGDELLQALVNIAPPAAASMALALRPTHQPSLASRFAAESAAMMIHRYHRGRERTRRGRALS